MTDDELTPWANAGLFDPADPASAAMAELFRYYSSIGLHPDLLDSHDPDRLGSAINRYLFQPGVRIDAAEVCARLGLDDDGFRERCRVLGFDPDRGYSELEVETIASFDAASTFFSTDEVERFVRALGAVMDRLADAASTLFQIDVLSRMDAEADLVEMARKNVESVALVDVLFPAMRAVFLDRLTRAGRLNDLARAGAEAGRSTVATTIGFVDVVGSTSITTTLDPDDLGLLMADFEARAYDLVHAHPGRIIKLIGDEVMFTAVDPDDAVDLAIAFVRAFTAMGLEPRAGLCFGQAVSRGGDLFGAPVNTAARLVGHAVPGEILLPTATAAQLGRHDVEPAGRRQLRGFDEPMVTSAILVAPAPPAK